MYTCIHRVCLWKEEVNNIAFFTELFLGTERSISMIYTQWLVCRLRGKYFDSVSDIVYHLFLLSIPFTNTHAIKSCRGEHIPHVQVHDNKLSFIHLHINSSSRQRLCNSISHVSSFFMSINTSRSLLSREAVQASADEDLLHNRDTQHGFSISWTLIPCSTEQHEKP